MNCTCPRCGKIFDYEQHNGICPKCAAYCRPAGSPQDIYDVDRDFTAVYKMQEEAHEKLHEMYDSTPAHQPERQHAQYHRTYDSAPGHQPGWQNSSTNRTNEADLARKKRGVLVFVVVLIIVIIAVVLFIQNRIYHMISDSDLRKFEVIEVEEGSSFGNQECTIAVDDAIVIADAAQLSVIPDYEVLVAIHVTAVDENGVSRKKMKTAPLLYCDGVYRGNLSAASVEAYLLDDITYLGITEKEVLSEYARIGDEPEGYFFYFIPAETDMITVVYEERQETDSERIARQYHIPVTLRNVVSAEGLQTQAEEEDYHEMPSGTLKERAGGDEP